MSGAQEARRRPCKVLFQTFTEANGQWGLTKTWVTHAFAWVSIEPDRGQERNTENEKESVTTHVVRGDYFDLRGVKETMRMIYHPVMVYSPIPNASEVYQVLTVMPALNDRSDVMIRVAKEGRQYSDV